MTTTYRARLVSFDHSYATTNGTMIAGIVGGSLGHATHGEILDCEITIKVVRRMRSLSPLGSIENAVVLLGDVPAMIEQDKLVIIEGPEAMTHERRDKCVCGECLPATCVCRYLNDLTYEERNGQ